MSASDATSFQPRANGTGPLTLPAEKPVERAQPEIAAEPAGAGLGTDVAQHAPPARRHELDPASVVIPDPPPAAAPAADPAPVAAADAPVATPAAAAGAADAGNAYAAVGDSPAEAAPTAPMANPAAAAPVADPAAVAPAADPADEDPAVGPDGIQHISEAELCTTFGESCALPDPEANTQNAETKAAAANLMDKASMVVEAVNPLLGAAMRAAAEKAKREAAKELADFSRAATSKTSSKHVAELNTLARQAQTALKAYSYFETSQSVTGIRPDVQAYFALKDAVAEIQAAANSAEKPDAATEAAMRTRFRSALEAFTATQREADLSLEPYRSQIAKQYDSLRKRAGMVDANGNPRPGELINNRNVPDTIRNVMRSYNATSIADLQRKLGLTGKDVDGILGPKTLFYMQVNSFDRMHSAVEQHETKLMRRAENEKNRLESMHSSALGLQQQGLDATLAANPQILEALAAIPANATPRTMQRIPQLNRLQNDLFAREMVATLYEMGYTAVNGQLVKRQADGSTAPITSDDRRQISRSVLQQVQSKFDERLSDKLEGLTRTTSSEESRTHIADMSRVLGALELDPNASFDNAADAGAAYTVGVTGGAERIHRQGQVRRLNSGEKIARSEVTNQELAELRLRYGRRLVEDSNGDISVANVTEDERRTTEARFDWLNSDDPAAAQMRQLMDEMSVILQAVFAAEDLVGMMGLPSDDRLAEAAAEEAFFAALTEDEGEGQPTAGPGPVRDTAPVDDGTGTPPMQAPTMGGGIGIAPIGTFSTELIAESRRDHAEDRAEALREEARRSSEAYQEALQKAGTQRAQDRREVTQIADTDVVGGRVIQKNADGTVIGTAQPATTPTPA